jgi:hypothetical protein
MAPARPPASSCSCLRTRLLSAAAAVLALLACAETPQTAAEADAHLGPARAIAPGVLLYHVSDRSWVAPAAPLSIWILRVDLARADVRLALANDAVVDTEAVGDTATRHRALAAINAGFFLQNGDPSGIYKLAGQLISDTRRPRGAIGLIRETGATRLIFGQVAATMALGVARRLRSDTRIEIAGVDTTRQLGKLMLFTPAYHTHTGTAAGGLEWIADGTPLRIRGAPRSEGNTAIPANGVVLSFGGRAPPDALRALQQGSRIDLETIYAPIDGDMDRWREATEIVGGAGLLLRDGARVENWTVESLSAGFAETRHPRTLVGTRPDGSLWFVTVDGRQPEHSVGMTLLELRALAERIGLVNALNLDGGGSTTMWAAGQVVNKPSDPAGPRKVSDALLVFDRSNAVRR